MPALLSTTQALALEGCKTTALQGLKAVITDLALREFTELLATAANAANAGAGQGRLGEEEQALVRLVRNPSADRGTELPVGNNPPACANEIARMQEVASLQNTTPTSYQQGPPGPDTPGAASSRIQAASQLVCQMTHCDEQAAQQWLPLCVDHTTALRTAALAQKCAQSLTGGQWLVHTPTATGCTPREFFWHLCSIETHIEASLIQAQNELTDTEAAWNPSGGASSNKFWRRRLCASDLKGYAKAVLKKLMVPYLLTGTTGASISAVAWGGRDPQLWCVCPHRVETLRGDTDPPVHRCTSCCKLCAGVLTALAPSSSSSPPVSQCMRCALPCSSHAAQLQCFSCLRKLHLWSGGGSLAPLTCTYDPCILQVKVALRGWLCPDCTYCAACCVAQQLVRQPVGSVCQGRENGSADVSRCTAERADGPMPLEGIEDAGVGGTVPCAQCNLLHQYRSPGKRDYHRRRDIARSAERRDRIVITGNTPTTSACDANCTSQSIGTVGGDQQYRPDRDVRAELAIPRAIGRKRGRY
jgi:hypothetical protein